MAPRGPVPHVVRPRGARSRLGRQLEALVALVTLPVLALAALGSLLASSMHMAVGTRIRREVRSGTGDPIRIISSQVFLVALTERGRTGVPIACDNATEWEREFGDIVSYGFGTHQVLALFAEGGTRVHTLRKVGDAAAEGTLTLVDRAGTPLNTMRIDAISAGDWSTDLEVQVEDGTEANTFTLTLWLHRGEANQRREVYRNHDTVASCAAAINGASTLATATDLGSATAYPARRPAVIAATPLSAGNDDRASIVAADMTAELDLFPPELGPGLVIIPGYHGDDIGVAVGAHCLENGREAFLHGDETDTITDAQTSAIALRSTPGAECIAWIHPWVKIADPDGVGDVTIPPVGVAAGIRARAQQAEGPHRMPAGDDYPSRYVTGVAQSLTRDQVDTANENNVVPIVAKNFEGSTRHELYGYRSLSGDETNFYHLTGYAVLAALAWDVDQAVQPFPFRPLDARGKFEAGLASVAEGVAQRYATAGALYPQGDDPGYSVAVETFPDERRALVTVAGRVTEGAELVEIATIKVALAAAV